MLISIALKHFVDVPYTQGKEAVTLGNCNDALASWCSMAHLKLCCSLVSLPPWHPAWPRWCFNTRLHCSAVPTEGKGTSVLQGPLGCMSPATVTGNPPSLTLENVQHYSPLQVS